MESSLISAIGQVGFPIVVAMYSLIVLNKSLKENTEVMAKLIDTITMTNITKK